MQGSVDGQAGCIVRVLPSVEGKHMRVDVLGTGRMGLLIAGVLARRAEVSVFEVAREEFERVGRERLLSRLRDAGEGLEDISAEIVRAVNGGGTCGEAPYVVISPCCTGADDDGSEVGTLCARYVDAVTSGIVGKHSQPVVVIAAPVPPGFTDSLCVSHPDARLLFCSGFTCMRDTAVHDGLRPSHVVMGVPKASRFVSELWGMAESFAGLLLGEDERSATGVLVMWAEEAESVGPFADGYLRMQESFVEGLRTFSDGMGLDADSIIAGLGLGAESRPRSDSGT